MLDSSLSHTLRVALAQINTTVGDLEGNTRKIIANIAAARRAARKWSSSRNLRSRAIRRRTCCSSEASSRTTSPRCEASRPRPRASPRLSASWTMNSDIYNAAAILHDGEIAGIQHKFFLPNYGVFDEDRYFQAGTSTQVYKLGHIVFGVEVCEDVWYAEGPHARPVARGRRACRIRYQLLAVPCGQVEVPREDARHARGGQLLRDSLPQRGRRPGRTGFRRPIARRRPVGRRAVQVQGVRGAVGDSGPGPLAGGARATGRPSPPKGQADASQARPKCR